MKHTHVEKSKRKATLIFYFFAGIVIFVYSTFRFNVLAIQASALLIFSVGTLCIFYYFYPWVTAKPLLKTPSNTYISKDGLVKMNIEDREKLYIKAIGRWGTRAQLDILIEEMAELTKAIIKDRRDSSNGLFSPEFIEELGDVIIMVEQAQIMLDLVPGGEAMLKNKMDLKLDRIAKRLEKSD